MIVAEKIDKRFADVHAVKEISLTAHRGEIFGLLGPNGAGKSTIIRMLVHIIHPDAGTITYDGQPYNERVRASIGYLPEERGLYQKSRVMETIVHFARLHDVQTSMARDRAKMWLRRFNLEERENANIEELSKGNQQKVQLIITLLHEPDYLILDEPSSGLDPMNQEILADVIEELRQQNRVIIYSTHQMDIAERLCNRIALVNKGDIVLQGPTDMVRSGPQNDYVKLEFSGDGGFLDGLAAVRSATVAQNFAEIELTPGASINDLVVAIDGRIDLARVERVRPSLRTIFIRTIQQAEV